MSALYTSLAQTASELIEEFGQLVTVTRFTRTIDPVDGYTTADSFVTGTFKAVNPPASPGMAGSFDNGVMGEASSTYKKIRFLILAAYGATFEPAAGDKVTMDGDNYTIFGCTPVSPDSTDIVYRVGMGV